MSISTRSSTIADGHVVERRSGRSGALFQEHRGLSLVRGVAADTQQRGDRVEEPARRSWSTAIRGPNGAGRERRRPRASGGRSRSCDLVEHAGRLGERHRHPPRMARRAVAAGLAHGPQPADARRAPRRAPQELAAPDRSVVPESQSVERDPQHLALQPALGHRRGDVRVMVLHGHPRDPELLGEPRAREVRVQVVRDELRLHSEDLAVRVERAPVGGHRLLRVQVADVLREERASAGRQAERAVQLGPHAERRHPASGMRGRSTTARRTGRVAPPTAARRAAGPRRPGRRSARRSRDRAGRTRRRCRRDGRAPRRSRCRSARRSHCRSSSRAGPRPRGAAGDAAASRGASRRSGDGPARCRAPAGRDRPPGRSGRATTRARQPPRSSARTTRAPPRDRPPSPRTACPGAASAHGAVARPPHRSRRTPGGTLRAP